MKRLLLKEWKLVTHPAALAFLALSAMLLIPNYPFYVCFFYCSLGAFFICLNARENNDLFFTASLPVCRRDIVRARMSLIVLLETAQLLLAVPFALIRRQFLPAMNNQAGIEANAAFFGLALTMLGLFNLVFFTRYFAAPHKVGAPFILGSIVQAVFIFAAEASVFAVPFMRDCIDTFNPAFLLWRLLFLAAGIVLFAAFTALAYRLSVRRFAALDLTV